METTARKATIKKAVRLTEKPAAFQVVKKLSTIKLEKGTEVLITDEGYWKGVKQYSLRLADGSNPTAFKVTESQFEFSEKVKYQVSVCRTSYAYRTIEVEALNEQEAAQIASEEAGNLEFSEKSAEYSADYVIPLELVTA